MIGPVVNDQALTDPVKPSGLGEHGEQHGRVLVPADELGDFFRHEPGKVTVGSVLPGEMPETLENTAGDCSTVCSRQPLHQGLHLGVSDGLALHPDVPRALTLSPAETRSRRSTTSACNLSIAFRSPIGDREPWSLSINGSTDVSISCHLGAQSIEQRISHQRPLALS
jgi:hypothetical protein